MQSKDYGFLISFMSFKYAFTLQAIKGKIVVRNNDKIFNKEIKDKNNF